jgi:hypothetical protein
VADAILDGLVHNAVRIELKGDSMREKRGECAQVWRLTLAGFSSAEPGTGPLFSLVCQPPLRSGLIGLRAFLDEAEHSQLWRQRVPGVFKRYRRAKPNMMRESLIGSIGRPTSTDGLLVPQP